MARVVKNPQAMNMKKGSTRKTSGYEGNKIRKSQEVEVKNKLLKRGKKQGSKLDESDLDLITLL